MTTPIGGSGLSDERGLVLRYRGDDGLEGAEGSFLLCTFWLAEALAVTDRVEEAEAVLHRAAGYASDLGLLSEEVDAATGSCWGTCRRPSAISGSSSRRTPWRRRSNGASHLPGDLTRQRCGFVALTQRYRRARAGR